MRKRIAWILLAVLLLNLAACGGEKAKSVDLNAVYEGFQETLPEMMVLDEDLMMNLLGIPAEDCAQVVTAVCADGLAADEVWLIEAKDAQALERLKALAQNRLEAKAEETENYLPDQYVVVKQAQVVTQGNYLALLVSPQVDALKAAFEDAVK